MATQTYGKVLTTNSSTYTFTPRTGDMTGYRCDITIAANKNCTAKVQYSTNGTTWTDAADYDALDVETESYPVTVRLSKFIRVGVINDVAAETDSVTVSFSCVSDSPQYATTADVTAYFGLITENTSTQAISRQTLSASTLPTSSEVNDMLLAAEDYIDETTGHAWRERQVTNEYHDFEPGIWVSPREFPREANGIKLLHRTIEDFTSGTDKLEVWKDSSWREYIENETEGRGNDFWVDYTSGIIYLKTKPRINIQSVRVTYRYGEDTVPDDIRECCALIVARKLMLMHGYVKELPEGPDSGHIMEVKLREWQTQIDRILENRKEARWVT